ncbi:MAG: putative 4-hydroxybenzoate polyprenyltransferase [Acidobacteriia bacterium]|nr:putative 4-hydroxybenzoate polyprenyltransferase [Terriglobia bacterium]
MAGNSEDTWKPQRGPGGLLARVRLTLEMIKFEHSVFALPFALTGAMLARRGLPTWRELLWIVVAMVSARSAAMTFNRVADLKLDALNPRTRTRALPTGRLSRGFAVGFTVASCALLALAAWELNPLAFRLSPVAIAILLGYSFTKRFTVVSHLILGLCLGMSPAAAWIALRGDLSASVLLLGGAVMLWVAGFDILYACQDVEFDHSLGLHSVPRRYGIRAALWVSGLLHLGTLVLLVAVLRIENLGWMAAVGLGAVAVLLAYEHSLVKPSDLSRVNAAFFTVNGFISILFFLTWAADLLIH